MGSSFSNIPMPYFGEEADQLVSPMNPKFSPSDYQPDRLIVRDISHIFQSKKSTYCFVFIILSILTLQVYPYLVVNDANLTEARREERVLQLLRMMNHFLTKQKETSQRLLYFTVPRVVAVAPQMRLVEDNPASTSLLDIFKQVWLICAHSFTWTAFQPDNCKSCFDAVIHQVWT